jgi:transposase
VAYARVSSHDRKVKGSKNRNKARQRLARLHALHKLTTDITRRFHTIGIEDLNVRGKALALVARPERNRPRRSRNPTANGLA